MGSNIALTLSDWATKLYNNFKFPGFSEMLWDNSASQHTIKQNVSRFLQVPELIDAFWSSINSFPFFLLQGETNSLFLFLCFIGVTWPFIIVIIIIRRSLESIKQVVQQLHELLVLTFITSRVAYCDSLLYSFLNSQVIKTLLSLVQVTDTNRF